MRRLTLKYFRAPHPLFFSAIPSLFINKRGKMWTRCAGGPNFEKRQYSGLIVPFLVLYTRVREVRDGDELGVTPRQRAASSIIHLGNKLINSVNEEEQRRLKEPFSGWRRRVAHINQPGTQLWSLRQPVPLNIHPPESLSNFYITVSWGKKIPFHHRLMWAAAWDTAHASEYIDIPVQLLYIKFVQDTSGMNYHLVATVTPLMQETPRCVLKEMMILFLIFFFFVIWFWKTIPVMMGRREIRRAQEGEKIERKGGTKKKEGRRGMRQGLTRSDWQPRFSQFGSLLPLCFCEGSRNTSSAIHFISIPTPASHLHSVSFTSSFSFLHVPLHFLNDNGVTFSLAVHRHNATCIQSREKWSLC